MIEGGGGVTVVLGEMDVIRAKYQSGRANPVHSATGSHPTALPAAVTNLWRLLGVRLFPGARRLSARVTKSAVGCRMNLCEYRKVDRCHF